MSLIKNKKGLSLVESIISIVVFLIGISGGFAYYFFSQTSLALELNRRTAAEICYARMDFLKTVPYNSLDQYAEENTPVSINNINGYRKTIIENIDENNDEKNDYKEITVRVEWTENGKNQNVEIITFISQ